MNPATGTRSYYPALDGLRGLAIILVLFRHNLSFIPSFQFGWIGVDLFFVLSGFLITDILLTTRQNKKFIQHFYIRRVLKIFPLYYGALLLFFFITPLFQVFAEQYQYYHSSQMMSWFHLQNWLYIFKQKPDSMLLNHFWSLSLEEQFYLAWPFVILAVKQNRNLATLLCLALAACITSRFGSWLYFGDGYTNYHFQYMTRIDGLCVGSLIAVWRHTSSPATVKNNLRILVTTLLSIHLLALIVAKTIFPGFPHFQFFGYSSLAGLFGLAVHYAVEKRTFITTNILQHRYLAYTGKISYGLYVYHWPILVLLKLAFMEMLTNSGLGNFTSNMILALAGIGVALLVSAASYHFFEKKILALKDVITSEGFFTRTRKRLAWFLRPASSR